MKSVTLSREPVPPTIITSAMTAANHVGRLGQRQQRRHVALGNRVVRPAGIVANADVAGRHVRQILEHPQRVHLAHRLARPALDVEVLLLQPRDERHAAALPARNTSMPAAPITPNRSGSIVASASPASCQASSAAAEAS